MSIVLMSLNAVLTTAIESSDASDESRDDPNGSRNAYFAMQKIVMQNAVPITLNVRWMTAALFASLFAPKDDMSAVMHVPIPSPMMIGTEAPTETCPVVANACNIPTEAELD